MNPVLLRNYTPVLGYVCVLQGAMTLLKNMQRELRGGGESSMELNVLVGERTVIYFRNFVVLY